MAAKSNGKELVTREVFYVDLPDTAPVLGVDPYGDGFSWRDIYTDNYFNTENLAEMHQESGHWPVFTPVAVSIEQIQVDVEKPDLNKAPDLVIAFAETSKRMICNKTRAKQLAALAGTQNPALWAERLPVLQLYVGVEKSMSMSQQVLAREAPAVIEGNGRRQSRIKSRADVEDINDDLFGS